MEEIFDEIAKILDSEADIRQRYAALRRIFRALLDDFTDYSGAHLLGTFAQTDYLLKKHGGDFQLRCRINDARQRFRNSAEMDGEILREHLASDAKALAFFAALLLNASVPETLRRKLPLENALLTRSGGEEEYVRFVVSGTDDEYIYGMAEGEDVEVRISFASSDDFNAYDWTYLRPFLAEGTQLNIVRPRRKKDSWAAGLIILEPDWLVDISSVASCFEAYGATPLSALLGKLRPQENTEPMLLGNLAGQMLDEEVNHPDSDTPYAGSVRAFFKNAPLSILSVGSISPAFHAEARRQQQIIRRAVRTTLPQMLGAYRPDAVMLEPSFFSEMLGLQGRMDFLQLDMRLLIEQKAGKSAFPQPRGTESPRPAEKHYVQMLLYMELLRHNFRRIYEANGGELYSFLLYSRYATPLVGLSAAPQLFFEALRVRNVLVAQELTLAKKGFGFVRTLRAEDFCSNGKGGTLWENYQRPQIESVLQTARSASEKEWAYVERLLTFIANEHLHAKLGTRTRENAGFASKWHASIEEKRSAGDIYDALRLESPEAGSSAAVERVVFRFSERGAGEAANFRKGDIVLFYPYESASAPDVRRAVALRGNIEEITPARLCLQLRAKQSNAKVFLRSADKPWAVEHDFFESSFSALYRGVYSFLSAPKERRDLLLFEREPKTKKLGINGDYGDFNELARRVKQAEDFFLIVGPPGTGKTSFGMLNTLKEALSEEDASVLLLAYTNRAVDEICSKLVEEGIPFTRIGSRLSCAPEYHACLLEERLGTCCSLDVLRSLLLKERVIVGTTSALASKPALLELKPYALAIIDEASQLLEPQLLGLLSAKCGEEAAIRKFVMIGDHKQLPAVVLQEEKTARVEVRCLKEIGLNDCRLSLFERLLHRYGNDPRHAHMLTRQGRMHEAIADFVSRAFYENKLRPVPLPHQKGELSGAANALPDKRVLFFAVSTEDSPLSDKVNVAEAELIARLVKQIYDGEENFSAAQTVGIIVPYRNQISAIRSALARFGIPELGDISIDTVERYQGSQREHIIYGFTVHSPRQLRFLTDNTFVENGCIIDRKLNVAMTRARRRLCLVGNPHLLRKNSLFARLLDYVQEKGGYIAPGRAF